MEKTKLVEPRKLKGFRDYAGGLNSARDSIRAIIIEQAQLAGFESIHTPALEYQEVLLGSGGEETDKQIYRFTDHGKREVALRFDLTIPFARFVAENQGTLQFPFKKLQMGSVWRGESPQKGRYREFTQCDLDIIGVDSLEADVEIISCLGRILNKIDCGEFKIGLGNRVILTGLIQSIFPTLKTIDPILIALDKLEKIGKEKVLTLLTQTPEIELKGAEELLDLLLNKDPNGNTNTSEIQNRAKNVEGVSQAIERFNESYAILKSLSKQWPCVLTQDLSIARGLGYYTGLVFETTLSALPNFGSICSGGRYDDLVSRFTKRSLAGMGGSIGLDRLVGALEELDKVSKTQGPDVFIAIATSDAKQNAFELLAELRNHGIKTEIGLQTKKLGPQFSYADKKGTNIVLTLGTDEVLNKTITFKTLSTGEQKSLGQKELIPALNAALRN